MIRARIAITFGLRGFNIVKIPSCDGVGDHPFIADREYPSYTAMTDDV